MSGILMMVIAIVVLGGAYLLYGRYLQNKWGIDPNVVNLSFSRHFLHQKLCHFEIKSIKTIFSTTTLTSPQNK